MWWKSSMHRPAQLLLSFIILMVRSSTENETRQVFIVGSEIARNLSGQRNNMQDNGESSLISRAPKGFSATTNSELVNYHDVNRSGIWNMTIRPYKAASDKKNLLSAKIKQENKSSEIEVEKRNTGVSNHRRLNEPLRNPIVVRQEYLPSEFSSGTYKTKKTYNHQGGGAYDEDTFYDEGPYDVKPVYEGDSYSNFHDDYAVSPQTPSVTQHATYNPPYYSASPVQYNNNPYVYYGPETSYGTVGACRCPSQSDASHRKRPVSLPKSRYPECPDQMAEFVNLMGSLGGNAWSLVRLIGVSSIPLIIPILLLALLIVPFKILKFVALLKLAFKLFVLLPLVWKVVIPALSHLNLHHILHKFQHLRPHSDESREEEISTPRSWADDFKNFNSSIFKDSLLACSNEAACQLGSYLAKSTNDHFPQKLTSYLVESAREAEALRSRSQGTSGSLRDETIAAFTIALGRKWRREDCHVYNCKLIH